MNINLTTFVINIFFIMNKKKIFNDPLYGLVGFDHKIIYDIIDHPYFQRLRRIKQLGFADYIYPGATHSRFQHSLGALHLMKQSIETLRWKGVDISDEEYKAASIAILLHDTGHTPFSHTLEKVFFKESHEQLSLMIMQKLNEEWKGELDLAIKIFTGEYERRFFHELISSQLDVDRLDYLNRDSYFTGVAEGVIGYDRIIKMLNVVDDKLVVEEKALYSIEKFLVARKIMHWQVYLHKTVIVVDRMLSLIFDILLKNKTGKDFGLLPQMVKDMLAGDGLERKLQYFKYFDDTDIVMAVKLLTKADNKVLRMLAKGILDRKLLKIVVKNEKPGSDYLEMIRHKVETECSYEKEIIDMLIFTGCEHNDVYSAIESEDIHILTKGGEVKSLTAYLPSLNDNLKSVKYFVIYPKCS